MNIFGALNSVQGLLLDIIINTIFDLFWDGVDRSNGSLLTALGSVAAGLGAATAGGLALAGVLYSTSRADRRSERSLNAASESMIQTDDHHRQMVSNMRYSQDLTDLRSRISSRHARFSTVVTQLASDDPTVRIGGLYALSALADEWSVELELSGWMYSSRSFDSDISKEIGARSDLLNNKDHGVLVINPEDARVQRDACIGLLCAYLRAEPILPNEQSDSTRGTSPDNAVDSNSNVLDESLRCSSVGWRVRPETMPDREARNEATRILVQHTAIEAEHPWPGEVINLNGAHLEGAFLTGLDLRKASFDGAHLEKAYLAGARLEGSSFVGAHLEEAWLSGAHLAGAFLSRAYLSGSWLDNSDLIEARLHEADLKNAYVGSLEAGDEFSLATWESARGCRLGHDRRAKWNDETAWPDEKFDADKVAARQTRESWTRGFSPFINQHG